MKTIEGNLSGEELKIGIVASRFNSFIVSQLINGALDGLVRHGCNENNITIVRVPGAFEIPLAAKKLSRKNYIDAVICLGAVIRGATPHFDYVCTETSRGIAEISMSSEKPVIFGILTTDSIEQAIERAGSKGGNKGYEAAVSAIEMLNVLREIN